MTDDANFNNISGYFTQYGVIVPDTSTVKDEIKSYFTEKLGSYLDFSESSPLGVIVDALAIAVSGAIGLNAQNANQFNLDVAVGVYLDAIASVFGITRIQAQRTSVSATLTGVQGTVIPAGTMARTKTDGYLFYLESDVTLDANGKSPTGTRFLSYEYGPVECDIGELTVMDSVIDGWWSVVNESAAQLGRLVESDDELRTRVKAKKASGYGYVNYVYDAVMGVEGVTNCVVYENTTNLPKTINGITIEGHSIYVCVDGGVENDSLIAEAIFKSKSAGCGITSRDQGTASKTTLSVTSCGQTYSVSFYRPEYVQPTISVNVSVGSYSGVDITTSIKNIVTQYVDGLGIGEDVSSFGVGMNIQQSLPSVLVKSVYVDGSLTGLQVNGYQKAVGLESSISVVVE